MASDISIGLDISSVQTNVQKMLKAFDSVTKSTENISKSISGVETSVDRLSKAFSSTNSANTYNRSLMTTEKELKKVTKETNNATSAIERLAKEQAKADKTTSKFEATLKTVRAAAIGYATVLATMEIQQFVRDTFEAMVGLDALNKSFIAITGSSHAAGMEMMFVTDTAKTLGLNLQTLEKSYKDILAASKGTSLEGEKVRDVFTAINKASAVLGLTADQTEGALRALSQMISKGNVQAIAKSLALYIAICIEKFCEFGETLNVKTKAIPSQAC
jgi:chromosome segregation ATPase